MDLQSSDKVKVPVLKTVKKYLEFRTDRHLDELLRELETLSKNKGLCDKVSKRDIIWFQCWLKRQHQLPKNKQPLDSKFYTWCSLLNNRITYHLHKKIVRYFIRTSKIGRRSLKELCRLQKALIHFNEGTFHNKMLQRVQKIEGTELPFIEESLERTISVLKMNGQVKHADMVSHFSKSFQMLRSAGTLNKKIVRDYYSRAKALRKKMLFEGKCVDYPWYFRFKCTLWYWFG